MEEFASPQHYNGDGYVNADKAIKAMFHNAAPRAIASPLLMFWWGSAFKYLWRWSRKGGLDDLDKAIDCIRRMKSEAGDDPIKTITTGEAIYFDDGGVVRVQGKE